MGAIIPRVVTEESASGAQVIDGSLTIDRSNNYLERTPSAAGNRKTWTWSAWVKRDAQDDATHQTFFSAGDGSVRTNFMFDNTGYTPSGTIQINYQAGQGSGPYSTKARRDFSAFYHIVVAFDTTQATAANRIKCWVNGVEDVLGTNSFPNQNTDWAVNNTQLHTIGMNVTLAEPFGGKFSTFYLIDGQALDATYFGYTDPLTNTWRPKKYEGTYGTNGFYLPFDGNSPAGEDKSGNGNDWTPKKFGASTSISKATGPLPILNTINGGKVAVPGVRGQAGVAVTVYNSGSGNKYYLDGEEAKIVSYKRGQTVTFDTSNSTVSGHPFRFATAADAAGSTEYTTGSVTGASEGSVGAATTITFPIDAPETLYYYCTNHSGMGGSITGITTDVQVADPHASKCVLALSLMDMVDVSNRVNCTTTAKAVTTLHGSPVITDGKGDFYSKSLDVGAANSRNAIQAAASADFDFGALTNSWTIELWAWRTTNTPNGAYLPLWEIVGTSGLGNGWLAFLGVHNATNYFYYGYNAADHSPLTWAPSPLNQWVHNAMVCDGTTLYVVEDGVCVARTANSSLSGPPTSFGRNAAIALGTQQWSGGSTDRNFGGYEQDFRVYKGVAKYKDPGAVGKVVTLSATGEYFFPASSAPAFVPDTPSGVSYSSELTKPTAGAVTLDGSSDHLNITGQSDVAFGTGDFTLECFVYFLTADGTLDTIMETRSATNASDGFLIGRFHTAGHENKIELYAASDYRVTADVTVGNNNWVHVAAVRSSSVTKLYINGEAQSTTYSDSNNYSNDDLIIGENVGNSYQLHGSISNFRMVKGTAVYTSDFTPPTEPLTNITNTKLLCCQSKTSPSSAAVSPQGNNTVGYAAYLSGGLVPGSANQYVPSNCFDGSITTTHVRHKTTVGEKGYAGWYFNPPTGIPYNTLEIHTGVSGVGTQEYILNGGSATGFAANSWVQIDGSAGTLTSLQITPGSTGNNNIYLGAIRINGSMTLTDPIYNGGTGATIPDSQPSRFNPFDNDIDIVLGKSTEYCTWNPLDNYQSIVLSSDNLGTSKGSASGYVNGTLAMPPGQGKKWYWEVRIPSDSATSGECYAGVASRAGSTNAYFDQYGVQLKISGDPYFYTNGSTSNESVGAWSPGQVLGLAFDPDAGILRYYRDGTLIHTTTGIPTSTVNVEYKIPYFPAIQAGTAATEIVYSNFGQNPFKVPPPEGFLPLCAANLPRPGVTVPSNYIKPQTYTGNGGTNVIECGFQPDLVVCKARANAWDWGWWDSVRSRSGNVYNYLKSNSDDVQATGGTTALQSYNEKGFTMGADAAFNTNSATYASFNWKAGGNKNTFNVDDVGYATFAASGTTAGSITPTGTSIGTKQGFSIIQYTGTGAAATIPHGLNAAPKFVIIKDLDTNYSWVVGHVSLNDIWANVLKLEGEDLSLDRTYFNDTAPTDTLVTVSGENSTNKSGDSYIMYAWADIPGVQKFGAYVANNSADGPCIDLGFRPAIVMVKVYAGGTNNWVIWDDSRSTYNPNQYTLQPDDATVEPNSGLYYIDFLSNGFKLRVGGGSALRVNGNSTNYKYIYMAWADQPTHNLYGGQSNAR